MQRIRGRVLTWVAAVDPQASAKDVQEITDLIATSALQMGEAIIQRLQPALTALQPVVTGARAHADHDPDLRDALAAYDAARQAIEG